MKPADQLREALRVATYPEQYRDIARQAAVHLLRENGNTKLADKLETVRQVLAAGDAKDTPW